MAVVWLAGVTRLPSRVTPHGREVTAATAVARVAELVGLSRRLLGRGNVKCGKNGCAIKCAERRAAIYIYIYIYIYMYIGSLQVYARQHIYTIVCMPAAKLYAARVCILRLLRPPPAARAPRCVACGRGHRGWSFSPT